MYRYIKAMSESLSKIKDSLTEATDPLDHHLIKLLLFSDCDTTCSVSHWKDEVYSFLNRTYRAKGSNKFPKYKVVRSALAVDEDILDNYIKQVKSDYHDFHPCAISDSEIIKIIIQYHDWIAQKLSSEGVVTRDEVFGELASLGIK